MEVITEIKNSFKSNFREQKISKQQGSAVKVNDFSEIKLHQRVKSSEVAFQGFWQYYKNGFAWIDFAYALLAHKLWIWNLIIGPQLTFTYLLVQSQQ